MVLQNGEGPRRGSQKPWGESMDNDVLLVSDSTSSDNNEDGKGSWEIQGRPVRQSKSVVNYALEPNSASKPKTPQRKSGPVKRNHASPSVEVVELESDTSDSDFVMLAESSSSDDDSGSDYGFGAAKRNCRGHSRGAARRSLEEDDWIENVLEPQDYDTDSEAPARGRRAPANKAKGKNSNQRSRSKPKPPVPVKKLGWELSDDEWEDKWGAVSDSEFDAIKVEKLPLEQKDPPAELLMPLLPFQKEWLAWSLKQEAGVMKGGILADEMGMGKTIQAISLIVSGRRIQSAPKVDLDPPLASSSHGALTSNKPPRQLPQVKATLVICPLVAVIQWRNEVSRFTLSGSVNVLVYHGPRRSIGLSELAEYDIILTTYSIVEMEHRKHVMPPKDTCQWCLRLFYPDRMTIHQKYFCGPNSQRTVKQAKQVKRKNGFERQGTATSDSDVDDLSDSDECLKGKKKGKGVAKGKNASSTKKGKSQKPAPKRSSGGRGSKRKIGEEELEEALLEAADALKQPMEKASSSEASKGNSVLHSVKWGRIILDEAHSIKDRRSSTAKAIFALQSEYKWALSGTPLQNRVGELYSLVRFLGIHPFSYYFCRKCDCKSLDYQSGTQGQKCECGHAPLLHFCWWNRFIANPIKRWGYIQGGRRAMLLLKHKVLSNTLLRRTKLERAADLALPPRTAFLRRDAFDAREEDFYQALYTQSQSQFNTYVTAGTLVNNYAHIFDLLTRLRQAVDHPYLVVYSATSCKEAPSFESGGADSLCGLCHEPAEDSVPLVDTTAGGMAVVWGQTTGCHHNFCRSCIQGYIAAAQDFTSQCPKCQKPLTVDFNGTKSTANANWPTAMEMGYKRTSILNRIDLHQFQTSTKIDAVREELNLMLEKDAAAKAIIFSQFTSMLDLIGFSLQKSAIKFVKLDGSMTMGARDQMIEAFTNDADTKVFLMSLKAGGVALNLTVASHVFLMDPWWNPAVEQQAQDRIHRLGQFKPIRVIRFVIENTIEERILKLQEKKQLVFEGTVGGSAEALGRLTEEDLRFLFTN